MGHCFIVYEYVVQCCLLGSDVFGLNVLVAELSPKPIISRGEVVGAIGLGSGNRPLANGEQ